MIRFLIASVAVTALAGPALAEPWARLNRSESGDTYWADLGSLSGNREQRRAWIRSEYAVPLDGVAAGAVAAVALKEFDCMGQRHSTLQITYYGSRGDVVRLHQPRFAEWSYVTPDSVNEGHMRFVCSYPIGTDWRQIEGLTVEE